MVPGYLIDNYYSSSGKKKIIEKHNKYISPGSVSYQRDRLMSQTYRHQRPLLPAELGKAEQTGLLHHSKN